MKQKKEQLRKLRETLLNLIRTHPNSPEAAKWKQMLADIGKLLSRDGPGLFMSLKLAEEC